MKELLLICDRESVYARRLAEYISEWENHRYDVRVYSSPELLIDTYRGTDISILVVDEDCYHELKRRNYINDIKVKNVRILKKNRESEYESEEGIYKYQSADIIYRLIMNGCEERTELLIKEDLRSFDREQNFNEKQIKNIVKKRVQERLIRMGYLSDNETLKVIDECIQESEYNALSVNERRVLSSQIFYSIRGLDVLEELISDEDISEIMVNGENNIFYEKGGRLISSNKSFDSREMLIDIIQRIVSGANRTVNMMSPIVDARLDDGSRVNVVLEPVSLSGPILTIRRFPKDPLNAERLVEMGAVSEEIMGFLRKLVFAGYNILISGSTGCGKTTFLNILSGFIPKDERIITIEDSAELKIMGIDNLVRLEARNANSDGCSEITIRDLIKAALRMRPDRVIVGECRGEEAIDMLQAFTVGQDGSMSTIHANSAEDALYRLEMLMMLGGKDIPLNALRRQIAAGVDIIIQLTRLKDKTRKLYEIREVIGFNGNEIETELLYRFEKGSFIKYAELKNTYKLGRLQNI